MRSLSKYDLVKQALTKVAGESAVNNGTTKMAFECHFWDRELSFDKALNDLNVALGKALLGGRLEEVKALQAQIKVLPPSKVILVFKLIQTIPILRGTKIIYDGDKPKSPVMTDVQLIYVSEDSVELGLLNYEVMKSDLKVQDKYGNEVEVLKMQLAGGLIDVKEGMMDRKGKVVREPRAYVTAIAFKALQVVGKIMYNESETARKMYGMEVSI